ADGLRRARRGAGAVGAAGDAAIGRGRRLGRAGAPVDRLDRLQQIADRVRREEPVEGRAEGHGLATGGRTARRRLAAPLGTGSRATRRAALGTALLRRAGCASGLAATALLA